MSYVYIIGLGYSLSNACRFTGWAGGCTLVIGTLFNGLAVGLYSTKIIGEPGALLMVIISFAMGLLPLIGSCTFLFDEEGGGRKCAVCGIIIGIIECVISVVMLFIIIKCATQFSANSKALQCNL
jgi:hypothetical protein